MLVKAVILLTSTFSMNLYATFAYIFSVIRSTPLASATSIMRYQYKRYPSIGLRTARVTRKSPSPLSSYEMALVTEREDRWSLATLSNLSA